MCNKIILFFWSSFVAVTSAAFAEETSIFDTASQNPTIKHASSLLKDVWNYQITDVDSKTITISNIVIGLLLLTIGIAAAKFLSSTIRKRMLSMFKLDNNASSAIEKCIYYLLIVLITLTALDISNIPLSGLTFIGGALAIGIGFGSQNVLNNFISGIIIMIESPISVGDIIELDDKVAVVVNIGARCVHLKTYDNIDLLVPNSTIIQNNITNWSLEDNVIRVTSSYLIDGDCDPNLTKQLLEQAVNENDHIEHEYENVVCLDKFDLYGIKFNIYFFIKTNGELDRRQILSLLNMKVHQLLTENNIQIAYCRGALL